MKKTVFRIPVILIILSLLFSALTVTAFADGGEKPYASGDRVYFYNIGGNGATSGDLIIVESDGHFGLIDAGHRYPGVITDERGKTYSALSGDNLSSQIEFKNGRDAAEYMINSMGITHLDFILGTHSHSDHIGGIPDIASFVGFDESGNEIRLVNEDTVYFYKEYRHINEKQDDLVPVGSEPVDEPVDSEITEEDELIYNSSWHNQAFYYQAVRTMTEQGCALAELSQSYTADSGEQGEIDYSSVIDAASGVSGLSRVRYFQGDSSDWLDDFLAFDMGNLSIRFYNLFSHDTVLNENVNSVVAVITDGNSKLVSLSDINVENRTEQRLAKAIYDDIGTADVIKVSHHGTDAGSNSREMLDYLQPKYAVVTRKRDYAYGNNSRGAFSAAMVYARNNYSTVFLEAGASDFALVADFKQGGIEFLNLSGTLEEIRFTSADRCISTVKPYNGWSEWNVEWGENTLSELYYIYYGEFVPNWYQDSLGRYFYINADASYLTGWQTIGKYTYYFSPEKNDEKLYGEMYTFWNEIDGKKYYFDEKGRLYTGWAELEDGNWYYFGSDGAAATGMKTIGNTVYCFDENGKMYVGFTRLENGFYFFGENGAMKTGWIQADGVWYYASEDGRLLTGWQKIGGKWYYFDENARTVTGLLEIDSKTYSFNSYGEMNTYWQRLDGSWHYFGKNGVMLTLWQKIDGSWYYFDETGAMLTSWQKIGGKWYYFDKDGVMKTQWQKIGGKWYYFDKGGAMLTSWQKISNKWYYFDKSGKMLTGWQRISKKWYYFDKSGVMLSGKQTLDGVEYEFAENGAWIK